MPRPRCAMRKGLSASGHRSYPPRPPSWPGAPLPPPIAPLGAPTRRYALPDPNEGARTRNLVWLGIVILLGFLIPMIFPGFRETRVVFINIEALGEDRVPGLAKFMFLYPGLAGIAVILLAALAKGFARSIAFIGIGLLPFLVLLTSEDVQRSLGQMSRVLPFSDAAAMVVWFLGFLGLFVGSRARGYRPASLGAAVIGLIGGIAYLLGLFLPVLPEQMGTIGLISPFKLLDGKFTVMTGLGSLGCMGCLIAAAILCIMNISLRPEAEGRARLAFTLLVIGYLVAAGGILIDGLRMAAEAGGSRRGEASGEAVLAVILVLTKMVCWILGLLLLVPVGVTDLVVNLSAAAPAASGYAVPVPGYGPAPSPAVAPDVRARILQLKRLLDDGLISPEEYERKRADFLSQL